MNTEYSTIAIDDERVDLGELDRELIEDRVGRSLTSDEWANFAEEFLSAVNEFIDDLAVDLSNEIEGAN